MADESSRNLEDSGSNSGSGKTESGVADRGATIRETGHGHESSARASSGFGPSGVSSEAGSANDRRDRRGGAFPIFLGALVGGVVAASAGFVAGERGLLDDILGQVELGAQNDGVAANSSAITGNSERIDAVEAAIASADLPALARMADTVGELEDRIGASVADSGAGQATAELTARITALADEIAVQAERLGSLEAASERFESRLDGEFRAMRAEREGDVERLQDLSRRFERLADEVAGIRQSGRNAGSGTRGSELSSEMLAEISASLDARAREIEAELERAGGRLEARLASIAGELDARRAETESLLETARAAGLGVGAQADLVRVRVALEAGEPFAPALDRLASRGTEIPGALRAVAEGSEPRDRLIAGFPAAAREALAITREDEGVVGFVLNQIGARSVAPREGSDPDAILSRAAAAASAGLLDETLDELASLPDEARGTPKMAEWIAAASERLAAERGLAEIVAASAGN